MVVARAEPLLGVDWSELWELPLADLRRRFRIDAQRRHGEASRAAA